MIPPVSLDVDHDGAGLDQTEPLRESCQKERFERAAATVAVDERCGGTGVELPCHSPRRTRSLRGRLVPQMKMLEASEQPKGPSVTDTPPW